MDTQLQEITDKSTWESFHTLSEKGLFLQSWSQKKLYGSLGQTTWMLSYQDGEHRIHSLVTKVEARRGTFFFLPYGPMLSSEAAQASLPGFFTALSAKAREEGAAFIRISPYWEETEANHQLLKSLKFRPSPMHTLAETLWLLDLPGKSEEELMMDMEKKHRNLVRRAIKDGVTVSSSKDPEAVERFIELHWQTVQRLKFTPYPKSYFRQQVELFAADDQVLVFEAKHEGELLASAIIMYYGKAGAYHHGSSSSKPEHRKIPASYLLQWEAIREAQSRGCDVYNFWGIAPEKNPKHPFYGITHFKTGFGGRQFDLMPSHDLVLNKKYYLNWGIETFRKWKRGF